MVHPKYIEELVFFSVANGRRIAKKLQIIIDKTISRWLGMGLH